MEHKIIYTDVFCAVQQIITDFLWCLLMRHTDYMRPVSEMIEIGTRHHFDNREELKENGSIQFQVHCVFMFSITDSYRK